MGCAIEYTKVVMKAEHIPWIILRKKTMNKNKYKEYIDSRKEYKKVHVASKKVAKYNNFILEKCLHNEGIKGVIHVFDIA